MERIKSPVVWGVVCGVILTQLQQLSAKPDISGWDIAISILTVLISAFGAINNPTDKKHF